MVNLTKILLNKKGQDMSIGTLILIVLGIIVLVLLVLGFSLGWGNLWEKINIFGGGGSSLSDVATSCSLAVSSNSKYDYCQNFRKVKVEGKVEYVNCADSRITSPSSGGITCDGNEAEVKCQDLKDSTTDKTKFDDSQIVNGKSCAFYSVTKDTVLKSCAEQGGETFSLTAVGSPANAKKTDSTVECKVNGQVPKIGETPLTKKITTGYSDANEQNICCLP